MNLFRFRCLVPHYMSVLVRALRLILQIKYYLLCVMVLVGTKKRENSMKTSIAKVNQLTAWKNLETHYSKVKELHLRDLFADDPKRAERMHIEAEGIHFDYSKNRITDETLK